MSFNRSLNLGKLGEALYFDANCGEITRQDGLRCDFTLNTTNEGIELKTDYWCMSRTPNFFFERFSNREKRTPGGPWQAAEHGSTKFVYFFVQNLTYFEFATKDLVDRLNEMEATLVPFDVPNSSWVTMGYRVPRASLLELATEFRVRAYKFPKEEA